MARADPQRAAVDQHEPPLPSLATRPSDAAFRDPSRVHAMCEDYRAGAYADYEIDRKDHDDGNKITIPMLALWGDVGIASSAATPLDSWKNWATDVSGAPIDSGHFLTEENPDATAKALKAFFAG